MPLFPSKNVDFESLVAQPPPEPLAPHIPKIAHYIHSKVQNLTWIDYVVVRSAFIYVGVEKVKIWVPEDAELPGEIWGRLQRMENVEVVKIVMPEIVWGTKVQAIQHWSDLARIKILWEEGGGLLPFFLCVRVFVRKIFLNGKSGVLKKLLSS